MGLSRRRMIGGLAGLGASMPGLVLLDGCGRFPSADQPAAGVLGVQVLSLYGSSPDDLSRAFAPAAGWTANAVIVRGSLGNQRARIADLAARNHLPAIYGQKEFVDAGGRMSYGTSNSRTHRRAATFVDKILRGARPADLPVEQVTTVGLVVNLKALQALGLTLPPGVAARVTEWVE